jgi:DNA-directed RNA polymerase subunit RPC12/RpoP
MKCVECGKDFVAEARTSKETIHFNNPGDITFEVKATECTHCGHKTVSENDIERAMEAFEEELKKKNER